MLWIMIALVSLLATIAFIVYLVKGFSKFHIIKKISGNKLGLKNGIAFLCVAVIFITLCLCIDVMNAIVCILFLGVFWLVLDGIFGILKKFVRRSEKKNKEKQSNKENQSNIEKETEEEYFIFDGNLTGILAIIITVVYLSVGWYLAHNVWMKQYTIETDKKVGQLKVLQFADAHLGTTFDGHGFAKQVERMQKEHPDVVLIVGDYVDDDSNKEDMLIATKALGTLETTYGVYYVFGNHDKGYYGDEHRGFSADDLVKALEANGVTVLEDESIPIDNRAVIVGRQDRSEEERGDTRASMKELSDQLDQNLFSIVMDHQPDDYAAQAKSKVDLVLSGHTHGGQLFPITYVGEWIGENDRTYGYEKRDNTNFIVTSGISDWAIKFKTGCKSEFVVINVKGK